MRVIALSKLIKTSLLNGIAVLVKMLTLLGINKLLAVYVGPTGYAALGQFQNAVTMITTFASGAINIGVTKYTAEYYDQEGRQRAVWQTAGTISLLGSFVTSLLIIIFQKPLSIWFLKSEHYASVFVWFAVMLVFFVFNALLLAILNGKKEIGRFVTANIIGSIIALILTSALVVYYGFYGALVSLAIFQSITFFSTFIICCKTNWFNITIFVGRFDKEIAKKLAHYTIMAISTSICVPISHIFVRKHLGTSFGWEAAGYWEAMWRLSAAYLMFITTTLSVYYLPRLSEIKNPCELRQEIINGYKIILPAAILCSVFIYLFRDSIIALLFSSKFYPVRDLFLAQMIGDTLKIGSWILAFVMLGRAMSGYFVITEIFFSASFYCGVVWMTDKFGFTGVSWAYAANYLAYWIVMYFLIYRTNTVQWRKRLGEDH